MQRKPKLRELIIKVKKGEEDVVLEVVHRFIPLVRKYSRRMGYDEACSDLVVWIVKAVTDINRVPPGVRTNSSNTS